MSRFRLLTGSSSSGSPLRWVAVVLVISTLAVSICALGARAKYNERTKHWIFPRCLWGAVSPGTVTTMKPVKLTLWRLRDVCDAETTYENLRFSIPSAYLWTKDDLAGGDQDEILLRVAWPTGEPESIVYARDKRKPNQGLSRTYDYLNLKEVSLRNAEEWSRKYFISIVGRNSVPGGHDPVAYGTNRTFYSSDGERASYLRSVLNGLTPLGGNRFGLYAYDDPKMGKRGIESSFPEAGLSAERYVDSTKADMWTRTIDCGRVAGETCDLTFNFQGFSVTVSFGALNIADWRKIEAQAKTLLTKYLIGHQPPSRNFDRDPKCPRNSICREEPYDAWTSANLNNANIRQHPYPPKGARSTRPVHPELWPIK
jgi:hypothetical protein